MKRYLRSLVFGGVIASTALASGPAAAVTKEDIITLAKLGINEDEIIKTIDKDRTIFDLSVGEILELKKANVPEKVIKYMLATPKKFGTGTTTGPTGPGPTGPTGPVEPTETEEQRAAREERLRQEAAKLIEEKKKAEEAQRKAYAEGVLAKGRRLGDEGKYVEAIQAFQSFVQQGNFPPESEEAYFAKFGEANALVKANLLQSAAPLLVDLVLEGPDKPFFQTAFQQLRTLRKQVDYSPPQLERLADFAGKVTGFSQSFQDEFNYVLGEFFHEGQEWTQAVAFLDAVTPRAADYAKAQYLKGFIEVQNELYKSAVESFQRAIIATEENASAEDVKDLSFLALARIAYKIGDYDAAIYYYRKIPHGSYKQATAFYESAWVYFLKGDYPRALGTFHTLDSPTFEHYFYPEMWILEATAYLNTCHFDRTKLSLKRFEEDVLPLITPLESFLQKTQKPEEFYAALVSVVNGKKVYELPDKLVDPVLSNVEFYNLYRTIKRIEKEQGRIQQDAGRLGPYASELLDRLAKLRTDRVREIGISVRLILADVLQELKKFNTKYIELGIDLDDIMIEEKDRQQRALDEGRTLETAQSTGGGGSTAIIGSDTWRWPFEREYWSDEIGAYRSTIADKCVRESEQ
ncbi:MAG: tetratricopeptide repeat protein [Deltaproteobacteria bacterium]|nr:tetratricopeptide repeat protein [Deltaproteobacteria bacterium]